MDSFHDLPQGIPASIPSGLIVFHDSRVVTAVRSAGFLKKTVERRTCCKKAEQHSSVLLPVFTSSVVGSYSVDQAGLTLTGDPTVHAMFM